MVGEHKATAERRQALRAALISAAGRRIAEDGLPALTARAAASDVGCSVGAIYNVFDDLDGLIIAVNSKTLAHLDREIAKSLAAVADENDPVESLVAIGLAYCRFAAAHPHLWSALFEQGVKPDRDVPAWHMDEHIRLFAHVLTFLKQLDPKQEDEQAWSRARLMFSAVHGVVSLGMHELFIAVPPDEIETQVALLVRATARGLYDRSPW
ncbi:MAG: TetR/AcrR family transcriptional regulator [Hyphomicrobiaceae bacterium]|nr:TetR/AcrR family transcriptional regulator [Hyphomicrobiaceae bacterium]